MSVSQVTDSYELVLVGESYHVSIDVWFSSEWLYWAGSCKWTLQHEQWCLIIEWMTLGLFSESETLMDQLEQFIDYPDSLNETSHSFVRVRLIQKSDIA